MTYCLGMGTMSVESASGDNRTRESNTIDLLAAVVRLLEGAVAATIVPRAEFSSPIVWADLANADVAAGLGSLAARCFADCGPWGESAADGWTGWVEPIADVDGEGPPVGVLAFAVRDRPSLDANEQTTVALFARLCGVVLASPVATEQATQRLRLDELVSTISERLMVTTGPNLEAALDWTVEHLCRFLGADVAFLRRNDRAQDVSVLMAFYPPRNMPIEDDPLGIVPFDADPIFAATKDLKIPLIVRNAAETDDRYLQRVKDAGQSIDFTGAAAPLVHGDTTEGILAFVYLSEYWWSEREVNALRTIAALLVQLLHRVDAEDRLWHSALTDELTGLANRRALFAEVARRQRSPGSSIALLFMDLDRFKVMNDHLGHGAGDRVLQVIADRIRTSLRPSDFAARLGGDEFVVVLDETGGGLAATAAGNRLLEVISSPIDVDGQRVTHTGSVGIALCSDSSFGGEELLGQADVALYAAKSQGRNRVVVFDHELEQRVAKRSSTELELRQTFTEHALRLAYQPEVDLRTGKLLAVEALVRWQRHGELAEASQFIPVAEETNLITDIDRWVLDEACAQMAAWSLAHPHLDHLVVRVNISPVQLAVNGLARMVADCLHNSGLAPERLCLEITEQAVIGDIEQVVRVLHDVRGMGVQLAVDDFGTGFSSMIQLKNLPVDVLKVDRVFVDRIAEDAGDQAIVEAIVRLATAFELDVVGEGVERLADMETLVQLGCLRAQGYLLARPLPPLALEPLFARGGIDLASIGASAPA